MFRFALSSMAFVVRVNKTAKASAIAANNNNGLSDPARDVLDVLSASAAQCIDNVDQIRGEVTKHVHVARRRGKGHDHGRVFDKTQGLGAERVPEVVVGAAG